MTEFESPTYFLDLSDRATRANVERAEINVPVPVWVRQDENHDAPAIEASGVRDAGGLFVVTVTTQEGTQSHEWTYAVLISAAAAAQRIAGRRR